MSHIYCPKCGNHGEKETICGLCGTEWDVPHIQLSVKNQIMKRAIKLWQDANEPTTMEGHYLDTAENHLRVEMEDKTIQYLHSILDRALEKFREATEMCRTPAHEGEAYEWSENARVAWESAIDLLHMVRERLPCNKDKVKEQVMGSKVKFAAVEKEPCIKVMHNMADPVFARYEKKATDLRSAAKTEENTKETVWGDSVDDWGQPPSH